MGIFSKWNKFGFDKKGFDILKIHKDTGTKFDIDGFDINGFDVNGFNMSKIHKDTGTKFDINGFDASKIHKDTGIFVDTNGFDLFQIHKDTGTKFDVNGFDVNGFNMSKIHKDTGTKFDIDGFDIDGFDINGFDINGFDVNGFNMSKIHKDTGTKFDVNGFNVNGFDIDGFDVNQYDENKKHLIEYVGTIASIDSIRTKPKLFLDSISGNIHLEMLAFMGEEKFAKMVSGGNFDFYDNDSPAYILRIKFDEIDSDFQEKFISIIRRTFPRKFQIFPTNYSIGAYWINDLITEENASYYLRRILENYIFSKL
jgi:hypothetical protein